MYAKIQVGPVKQFRIAVILLLRVTGDFPGKAIFKIDYIDKFETILSNQEDSIVQTWWFQYVISMQEDDTDKQIFFM